jgi:hypothetical protein
MASIRDTEGKKWKLKGSSLKRLVDPNTGEEVGRRQGKDFVDANGNVVTTVTRARLNKALEEKNK